MNIAAHFTWKSVVPN